MNLRANPNAGISTPSMSGALAQLVRDFDSIATRMPLDVIIDRLRACEITLDGVRGYVRFDPLRYTRNLVVDGPSYNLLVLCWRSGQRSVIHDHAESSCAFKVL